MTACEELALVDCALRELLTENTQQIGSADRSRRALDLGQLIARKKELTWQVAREQGGGVFAARFRRPE